SATLRTIGCSRAAGPSVITAGQGPPPPASPPGFPASWCRSLAISSFWGASSRTPGGGRSRFPSPLSTRPPPPPASLPSRRPQIRARASELGALLRATDGVELTVQSIERPLPAPVMCCSHDPDHLAVLYCESCRTHVCEACWRSKHTGHVAHPYRYVDWSGPPPHGFFADVGELIGDAAHALQAGVAELLPSV